jgi:chemotaxis protein CheX
MSVATDDAAVNAVSVDPRLIASVIDSVQGALTMCAATAECVGIASVPIRDGGLVTGLIGVHGNVSGFITVNMSKRMAIRLVEGLLQDKFDDLTSQVVDAAGEITNIVVGGVKAAFSGSDWSFSNITIPSVIVGEGYHIAYAKGLEFLCATFEHDDPEAVMVEDRLMHVSVSLLRL